MNAIIALLEPGSLTLLTLALACGALAMRAKRRLARAGRLWIAAWVAAYFLLSLPVVARQLYAGLARSPIFDAAAVPRPVRAMVVLSGAGYRVRVAGEVIDIMNLEAAARVREAARVYRLVEPEVLILSGAGRTGADSPEVVAMREGLVASGVPAERILLEVDSRDTHQSAVAVAALLDARGIDSALLVTSASHLPRSLGAFRAAGAAVVGVPAFGGRAPMAGGWRGFLPAASALRHSQQSLHEYVGLAYYRIRGWA